MSKFGKDIDPKKAGMKTQFSSKNQPKNKGRKPNSVSKYLKELGEAKNIEFSITTTDQNGKEHTRKGKVESETDLNKLLAVLLFHDAINGDFKAKKEILDRTEGKPQQKIDLAMPEEIKPVKFVDATIKKG